MAITTEKVVEWCDKQERQKQNWLETFGPTGPKTREDYPAKQRDLAFIQTILWDHATAVGMARARPPRTLKAQEIADWCSDQIEDRRDWLDKHGSKGRDKRPQMEVDAKLDDIDMLRHIRRTYEDAIREHKKGRE